MKVEVPYEMLSAEGLRGLIEEFVTREGTDYGVGEWDLDKKVAMVARQLKNKEAVILFDDESKTTNIVLRRDLKEKDKG